MPALNRDERLRLQAELLDWAEAWQRGETPHPGQFDQRALALFRFQFQHIPAFRSWCEAMGCTPQTVTHWRQVPPVPVNAWKMATLWVDHGQPPAVVFETSGTSDGQPGRVALHDTACYDAALQATFAHFVLPDAQRGQRYRCISLVPGPEHRPRSSLRYMVERLAARWDDGHGSSHLGDGLDVAGLQQALQRASVDGVPVLLFATSIALDLWLADPQARGWRTRLPVGSRVMDTGGPKGRVIALDRAELLVHLADRLGLSQTDVVGELGMTELSTPRYETSVRARMSGDPADTRRYDGPPWLRSMAKSLTDRSVLTAGVQGVLAHVDLANVDSCAFVLTADLGEVDGDGRVSLAGRVPHADWRGCGLDAELLVAPRGEPPSSADAQAPGLEDDGST
jgi:hypothetical protein